MIFDPDSITVAEIRAGQEYQGLRVKIRGMLGTARLSVQIDVGLGDAVTPKPKLADFPTLLEMPAPRLRVYPQETTITTSLPASSCGALSFARAVRAHCRNHRSVLMQRTMDQGTGNGRDGYGGSRGGNWECLNWIVWVVRAMAFTTEVFLHRRLGSRYFRRRGGMAILVLLAYAAFVPIPGGWGVMLFLLAYVKACLVAGAGVLWRKLKKKEFEHTLYSGLPYLMRVFPRWKESTVKRLVEPLLVVVVAIPVMHFIPALGLYLLMAGGALFMTVDQQEAEVRRRAEMMHDAVIEATQQAERFREMSSGRR